MLKKKPLYELPIKRSYVSHWGLVEAVRELFQNAIDHGDGWSWQLTSQYASEGEEASGEPPSRFQLRITSPNVRLPPSCLILGETSKDSDDSKIGNFGEGFKLALLVLTREGFQTQCLNSELAWDPTFIQSETFGTEVFAIRETRMIEHATKGLEYIIDGLTQDDIDALRDSFLFMRPEPSPKHYFTSKGRIFLEDVSALYVGGLFICQTKLNYSYDLNPGVIQLERDRQTVADFDLQWLTKDMWLETQQWELIANMIASEVKDVEYVHYNCPELLQAEVYRQFIANNPEGIMARSLEQMQEMVKKGMEKVVYVGGAYGAIVCGAQPVEISRKLEVAPPADILQKFLSDNRKYMRTPAVIAFKDLINRSGKWKGN